MSEEAGDRATRAVAFGLVFAVVGGLLRVVDHALGGGDLSLAAALLGTMALIPLGVAVSPTWWGRTGARVAVGLAVAITGAHHAAYLHEAIVGSLPGWRALGFLEQGSALGASIGVGLVGGLLLGLVGSGWGLVVAGRRFGTATPRLPSIAASGALLLGTVALVLVHALPAVVGSAAVRARVPVLWLVQTIAAGAGDPDPVQYGDAGAFAHALGRRPPPTDPLPGTMLCAPRATGGSGNGRSVVLLVLESVGTAELQATFEGQPVMPALREVAAEHVYLRNIKAAGTRSGQALPALLSGLAPQPAGRILWQHPLPPLEGLAATVGAAGYATAYFHGGDLSFEQQDAFLRQTGFDTLDALDPVSGGPVYGWGHPDDVMLDRLRAFIDGRSGEGPYFASLFTLSSHHPYLFPGSDDPGLEFEDDWGRIPDRAEDFVRSLRFVDAQVAAFVTWFAEHEVPQGNVLVIIGDHTGMLGRADGAAGGPFDVPMVVVGAGEVPGDVANRLGSQFDVPATILGLLGLPPLSCGHGIDLLMPTQAWPADRWVYAVGGNDLEEIDVYTPDGAFVFDRVAASWLRKPDGVDSEPVRAFIELTERLSAQMLRDRAFAPAAAPRGPQPIPAVTEPVWVSHRGNASGPGEGPPENSLAAVEAAVAAGFGAVEIDVNVTRDGVAVLMHDSAVPGPDGKPQLVSGLTLAELRAREGLGELATLAELIERFPELRLHVEAKPQPKIAAKLALAREITRLVAARPDGTETVVDSFDPELALMIAPHCKCAVGIDIPSNIPMHPMMFADFAARGVEWVYLDRAAVSGQVIDAAHRAGLRVLVYTVEDRAELTAWGVVPDAVIVDHARLLPSAARGPTG